MGDTAKDQLMTGLDTPPKPAGRGGIEPHGTEDDQCFQCHAGDVFKIR